MHRTRPGRTLVFALIVTALPAAAATRVTVAQLEQFLAAETSSHAGNSDVAQRLAAAELTERLSPGRLAQIESKFRPGEDTLQALHLLADLSEFLHVPEDEVPRRSIPTLSEQKQMIESAERFASQTLAHLPDYLATQTTKSFEDVPVLTKSTSMQSGLYPTGTSTVEVTYRGGRQVSSRSIRAADMLPRTGSRMESLGQFGPLMATILADSAHRAMRWDHWEQTAAGTMAVFAYSVPPAASHYRVDFCCISNPVEGGPVSYHGTPGYHGTISVDPATGAIFRVTLEADFPEFDPEPEVDVMVDYRNVDVSGGSLICPVRSVAISRAFTWARKRYWTNLYVNEVEYSQFHRFGSTAEILENAGP